MMRSWKRCSMAAMTAASALTIVLLGSSLTAQPLHALTILPQVQAVGDDAIARAVDRQLWEDPLVDANRIDVTSRDSGVVTLRGTVSSLLERRRALRVTEAVRGVRALVDAMTVVPITRTDEAILEDVRQALAQDAAVERHDIVAEVASGRVTLHGTVESGTERLVAEQVASQVLGVREIINSIQLDVPDERSDREIAEDIRRQLFNDVRIDEELVDVTVEDGHVVLSGVVGSMTEKRRARYASWVLGVESVDTDALAVRPWAYDWATRAQRPMMTDSAITASVVDAFRHDPHVSEPYPAVRTEGGIVTLTGIVSDLRTRRAAEAAARHTVGVRWVNNYIKVRPDVDVANEDVAERVRDAFARTPYVEQHEILVTAIDGTVYLSGLVDSHYERWLAASVAGSVPSVIRVENRLVVGGQPPFKPDVVLQQDVEAALEWNPWVDSEDVSVAVVNGRTILTGTVDSWFERSQAVEEARDAGAVEVEDRLTIREAPVGTSDGR